MYFRKLLPVVVGVALAIGGLSGPAQAAPTAANQARAIQTMVDRLLVASPGAQKISERTVRLANGVEVTASVRGSCPFLALCIWNEPGYRGVQWSFVKCGFVNIGLSGWSNRIRSYQNDQSRGTVSIFMNWNGKNWEDVFRSSAPDYADDVDFRGGVSRADGLWVC